MDLQGRLEIFPVAEVIQLLALSARTGKLVLHGPDGDGVVVFRDGKLLHVTSPSIRVTLGALLAAQGRVDEETLVAALERQRTHPEERRLGEILVEMGALTEEAVVGVRRHQTAVLLSELLQWTTGSFEFEALEIAERGEVEIDASEVLSNEGLDAHALLLEVTTALDQFRHRTATDNPSLAETRPIRHAGQTVDARDMASLGSILLGLHAPNVPGELSLKVLRHAAGVMSRGVLFVIVGQMLEDVGKFGIRLDVGIPGSVIPSVRLPLQDAGVLREAWRTRRMIRGPLGPDPGNEHLLEQLGGHRPNEAVVIPVFVGTGVAMIYYGDDALSEEPIGSIEGLQVALQEAGLAMDERTQAMRLDEPVGVG